jgi:hypothetical protein
LVTQSGTSARSVAPWRTQFAQLAYRRTGLSTFTEGRTGGEQPAHIGGIGAAEKEAR